MKFNVKSGIIFFACFMLLHVCNSASNTKNLNLMQYDKSDNVNIIQKGDSEYEWSLPDGKRQKLQIDLKKQDIDLNEFDEFRFEIKPLGSQVSLATRIYGFPSTDDVSSWYLKFKSREGEWSEGRYDLRIDDDGIFLPRKKEIPENTIVLNLARRILGTPNEPTWRKALIRNPRFIRYLVKVDLNLGDCEIIEDTKKVSYKYRLKLENRTDKNQLLTIEPDSTGRLKYFTVSAPKQFPIGPKEKKSVEIIVSISRMQALALPPLYSERIYPRISIKGIPDSDVVPLMGYRPWPLWGVVPIFNKITWNPATMQAFLNAREKAVPKIKNWKKRIIGFANQALKYDWPIPKDILPGHTMGYRITESKGYPRPVKPTEFHKHVDPKTGKIYENVEKLDRAYVGRYYGTLAKYVYNCSLAYLITGDEKYAKKAIDILIALSDAHPEMPCAGIRSTSGGTKLACNSLLTSYVLPVLSEGFTYLKSAPCLTVGKNKKIKKFLIDEALMTARHSTEYSNQTAEHIRAYGSAAIATGFWPIAGEAIYGEFGWHEMVEYAYSEDGIGHEAGAYHRAIFGSMNHLASFALSQNVNLYTARFKRVFDGSLTTGVEGVSYETAYRVYRDPAYIKKLAKDRQGRCSTSLAFQGILGIPDVKTMDVVSDIMKSSGYIFLRKGTLAESNEIRLNYIKTFDRTEHDKFTTFFYKNGKQVDAQAGRIIYSSPLSHWMYETAAHNTIVINGENEADVDGQLIAYNPDRNTPVAVVSTIPGNPFYKGVRQIRCIALVDNAYIVFDKVIADKPCTIDRYQHGSRETKVTFSPKMSPVKEKPEDLPHDAPFSNIQSTGHVDTLVADFGNGLKMRLIADKKFTGFKADSFAAWQAYPAEVTFARIADTENASFLAGFVYGKNLTPPELKILKSSQDIIKFEVKTGAGPFIFNIDIPSGKINIRN